MITLKQAIRLALKERGRTMIEGDKVDAIADFGDRWAISFESDRSDYFFDGSETDDLTRSLHSCSGSAPMFVFKEDGKVEYFLVTEYLDLFEKAIPIEVPKDIED